MLREKGNRRAARVGTRGFLVAVTSVVTLLALPGPASAQAPCGNSAIDQYVECVPTGDGKSSSSGGAPPTSSGGQAGGSLPPSVASRIRSGGGEDAHVLQQVATSPQYGAPTKRLGRSASKETARIDKAPASGDDGSTGEAVSAAIGAVQGGDAARLVGLLLAPFLISLAVVGTSALRHKRRTSP